MLECCVPEVSDASVLVDENGNSAVFACFVSELGYQLVLAHSGFELPEGLLRHSLHVRVRR